ncbi:MAG: 50S ribosome-binding GTPase, partial [Planctomycetes bacterium]|nr:50S ribosome-binding GTPase [Planctomycetota bacterium]
MAGGLEDTIVALSSPPGASACAVVRLAGPAAWTLAHGLFDPFPARPRRMRRGSLRLPGWPPAPAACLGFRGPASYTGQDLVELWVPGSPPLIEALLQTLQEAGARLADRGEFTRRAFHAGRVDLVQVEAVLALTAAATAEEARGAVRALEGGVGRRIEAGKQTLLDVLAHVEAAIDFSEDELDLTAEETLAQHLETVAISLAELRREATGRTPRAHLPRVVLRGPPNAGKSTLFNRLTAARALVSTQAGTTRDVLERRWALPSGRAVLLVDTAGTGGEILPSSLEAEAGQEAEASAAGADLVLWVSVEAEPPPESGAPQLWISSQRDRSEVPPLPDTALGISAESGAGLSDLAEAVEG